MSDYLWDKTGEPDEEVVRLEELLGGLAHKPRALELPTEAAPQSSFNGSLRRFRPALLAAAALLLMILAGALVMLRQDGADGNKQSADADSQVLQPKKESVVAPREEPKPSAEPPKQDDPAGHHGTTAKGPTPTDFQAFKGDRRRRTSTGSRGSVSNRQIRHVAARQEPPAPTRVEREAAKEQLVYALRLASAKLGEVRKMTRGGESPRQSLDERNRIR